MSNPNKNKPSTSIDGTWPRGKGGSGRRTRYQKPGGSSNQKKYPKFLGLDKGTLEGIVIADTSNTPLAQQFDTFYNALIVHGGGINPQVKTALKGLSPITEKSMEPPLPDTKNYVDEDGTVNKAVETALFNIWTAKASRASKLHSKYDQDLRSLFSTVWGQLNIGIQDSMKGIEDWDDIDNNNDTIKLMLGLRTLCYKENNHKIAIPLDLLKKTQKAVMGREDPNKPLSTYIDEAKIKYEVLKSIGGIISSKSLIKYTIDRKFKGQSAYTYACYESYDDDHKKKIEIDNAASDIMIAFIIIDGSNDKAHRGLSSALQDQFSRNHDDYPTTPTEAAQLLKQYSSKPPQKVPKTPRAPTGNPNGNNEEDKNNSNESKSEPSDALLVNHGTTDNETDKDKDEAQLHVMTGDATQDSEFCFCTVGHETQPISSPFMNTYKTKFVTTKEPFRIKGYGCTSGMISMEHASMNNAYTFAQSSGGMINKKWILLDSQATCNVICNKDIVTNIRKHPEQRQLTIHCNAGQAVVTHIADLRGFGTVWFHPNGIANCLSLARVSDTYRVTLDTAVTQAFFVHKPDGSTRRFDRMDCNLYACDISNTNGTLLAIVTVDGQKLKYSDLDVKRATAARKLQDTLGYPSKTAFLKMIDNNLIMNCAVTRRDILMAEDIFGNNTNIIRGKAVRSQPGHVREDTPAVPY